MQWLRDNLKMIKAAPEVEELAQTVEDNGGCYVVPAFSGLFAPYWKSNARGVIAGLTRYVNAGHIARATLEATAYQSREVVEAMDADSGVAARVAQGRRRHGRRTSLLMQFQADLLGVPVIRPQVAETTALGAAYAAGLATGFWGEVEDLRENWQEDKRWEPQMDAAKRDEYYKYWKKAVTRTFDWFEAEARQRAAPSSPRRPPGRAAAAVDSRRRGSTAGRGPGDRRRRDRRRRRLGRRAARLRRHPRRPRRPGRGHERALPRPAALGRALRRQGPDAPPRSAWPRTRSCAAIIPDCIEDTGGLFVTTPDDDPAYGDRFLEGCRAGATCPSQEIPVAEALRLEPRLNPGIRRAFTVPGRARSTSGRRSWALARGAAAARRARPDLPPRDRPAPRRATRSRARACATS